MVGYFYNLGRPLFYKKGLLLLISFESNIRLAVLMLNALMVGNFSDLVRAFEK